MLLAQPPADSGSNSCISPITTLYPRTRVIGCLPNAFHASLTHDHDVIKRRRAGGRDEDESIRRRAKRAT